MVTKNVFNRKDIPRWWRVHGLDVWMWSLDCWTANKLMLICRIRSKVVEKKCIDGITIPIFLLILIFFLDFMLFFLFKIFCLIVVQKKKCFNSMDGPHGCKLQTVDIWMWSIDSQTFIKCKFVKDLHFRMLRVHCIFLLIWLNWLLSLQCKNKKIQNSKKKIKKLEKKKNGSRENWNSYLKWDSTHSFLLMALLLCTKKQCTKTQVLMVDVKMLSIKKSAMSRILPFEMEGKKKKKNQFDKKKRSSSLGRSSESEGGGAKRTTSPPLSPPPDHWVLLLGIIQKLSNALHRNFRPLPRM